MIISQDKNEILPLNLPANAEYSFSKGASLIQFIIPQSPQLLLTKTLKLNGKLRINRSTSTFSAPVFPNNINNKGTGAYSLRLNERVGINALFDNIVISSSGSGGQVMESLRNVGRLHALTKPLTHNQGQYDGELNGKDPTLASRSKISAVDVNTEVFFSIPIETGLTQGNESLPLGVNGLRGMEIQIQLANDQNVLITSEADKNSVYYSLVDLSLCYDTLTFDASTTAEMERPATSSLEYNSYAHQYQVVNASDTQLNLNFGVKNCLSVIASTVPTTSINNIEVDSMSTNNLLNQNAGVYNVAAPLRTVTFGRNGQRVPLDYEIEVETQSTENRPRVELIDELKTAMDVAGSSMSLVSLNTENQVKTKVNLNGNEVASLDPTINVEPEAKPVFGFGISEDSLTKVGRDFSSATFTLRIQSGLNGNSPNSINVFTLSKNRLNYSPQGISVSS
ncbi:MAG: hypothetical protein ACXAC7_24280 [Candidatus Hodarchaeales archaeon]|jgi:hypothetical protein